MNYSLILAHLCFVFTHKLMKTAAPTKSSNKLALQKKYDK